MKLKTSTILAVVLATTGISSAKEEKEPKEGGSDTPGLSRMIEMRPTEKRPLVLKEEERNPYERRTVQEDEFNEKDATSEEVRLREIITSLPISGSSRDTNGNMRLLLGDIAIEQGKYLPPLVHPQTDQLKILEITPEYLTIAWIDPESNQPTGKTMQLQYDLSPTITYGLPGQLSGTGESEANQRLGVMNIGKLRKKLAAQLAAEAEEERRNSGHASNDDQN